MTAVSTPAGSTRVHADALTVLSTWEAPDAAQEALRTSYVALLQRHANATLRSCIPAHITASAVVLDSTCERVLLTLHSKGKFWVQLGGHCEPDDASLAAAAVREATEESGIAGLELVSELPVDLDRHVLSAAFGSCGEHYDVRYVVQAPDDARPSRSDESSDLQWFRVDKLPVDPVVDLSLLLCRAVRLSTQPG